MKSLLILGEYHNKKINKNIERLKRYAKNEKLNPRILNYKELFQGKKPRLPTEEIVVMSFFPYDFWEENCEVPSDTNIYGTSKESYLKFEKFLKESKERLDHLLAGKKISYIINLDTASIDRDKIKTHNLLRKNNIITTKRLPKNLEVILNSSLKKGIFIKSRYGAMGKGITYLSPKGWFTNYKIGKNGRIENHDGEDEWRFFSITGNSDIIKRLLDLEVIVEEEIVTPQLTNGVKLDFRAYAVFDKVPHLFIRENKEKKIVTNYSQGGIVNHDYKEVLHKKTISLIKEETLKTASALNSKFLGVDVIFDQNFNTPKILEVQTFTGFPKISKFNLARYLAQCIKKFSGNFQ